MKIVFNKIYKSRNEKDYILDTIENDISYQKDIEKIFHDRFRIENFYLCPSATNALETIALAIDVKNDDELILPSYTLSSTANAFALRGAKLRFADSKKDNPNIDIENIKKLISSKTKAIVVVHYGGFACDIEEIADLCKQKNIFLIEDAAQALNSFYKNKALGTFGDFSVFSFHKTKNITCGEGGALVVNNKKYINKIEKIHNKGTNLEDFKNNKVEKYEWTSLGLSGTLAEINKSYLFAQLLEIDVIDRIRKGLWKNYYQSLSELKEQISLPEIKEGEKINYHIFYIVCKSNKERNKFQTYLLKNGIETMFHFNSLHKSIYFKNKYQGEELKNSDIFSDCLLRLPIYPDLLKEEQNKIIDTIISYYNTK